MNDDIISFDLYSELIFSINNLDLNFDFEGNCNKDCSILSYFLYKGCHLLYSEEVSFLKIGLDNYPDLCVKFYNINESKDLFLLEETISLYGSQSHLRYDVKKLSLLESLLSSHLSHLDETSLSHLIDFLLDSYTKLISIRTVGSYLDFLLNIFKKL